MTARLAPLAEACSTARLTAAALPEMTVCSGELRFAGPTTWPSLALRQISATWPGRSPRIAAMAPSPAGTASCMYLPRRRTRRTASANDSDPATTSAEYSPRLWPATKSGRMPFSSRIRSMATETVRIAGCVFSVSFSASSEPEKQSSEREKPSTRSASSNTARATGKDSASSRPMPEYCDPCPGNKNASRPIVDFVAPFAEGSRRR